MTTTNGHIEFSTNSRSEEQLQEFLQGNDTNNSGGETYANGIGVQHTSVSNTVEKAAKMLEVLMENRQKIFMKGNSVDVTHGVHASDVIVHQAPATQTKGSSKVKIRNIVDYGWEHKYYCGNVVAVHMSGNFMAYAIKITGKNESYVRIVNRKTSQRELLKGMSGQVKDIAFAYSLTQILLAVIDEPGTLFVYEITEPTDNSIRCTMMLQVSRAKEDKMCEYRRVTWCRYHPEDQQTDDACDDGSIPSSTDDYSKLLVMTHDNIAEMIDVDVVAKEYGKEVMSCTLEDGFGTIIVHTKPITEAVFSPDGSALATASLDGYITFYQVYLQDKTTKPRCLHTWKPFDGQPVTSLFFLDNHRDLKPDQSYWKFAVTGTDNNRQLKVWCCVDWSCLQTISFQSSDNESCIKACLDLSAEYLLLSDIKHRVLYILQLYQEPELSKACIVNLSEFPLICPMLSFTVSYVGLRRAKKSIDQSDNIDIAKSDSECDEDVDEDNDDVTVSNSSSNNANTQDQETVIKLCYVQPKSLQQCSIIFPSSGHLSQKSGGTTTLHGTSQDSINTTMSYKDALSDLSIDNTTTTTHDTSGSNVHDEDGNNASIIVQPASLSMQSTESKTKELLLTPEAFKSSPNVSSGTKNSGKSEQHVLTSVTSDDEVKIGPLVDIECISKFPVSDRRSSAEVNGNVIPPMRRSQHSDSSSPSREVAEILSPNTNESNNHKRSISREEKDEEETMDQNETCSNTSIGSGHYNHSGVGWPAAPDIQKIVHSSPREQKVPSNTTGTPPNKFSAYSDVVTTVKSNDQSIDCRTTSMMTPTTVSTTTVYCKDINEHLVKESKKKDKTLDSTMQAMMSVIESQHEELKKHQELLQNMNEELSKSFVRTEKVIASNIEVAQREQEARIIQNLENMVLQKEKNDKQHQEKLIASLSQVLVSTVPSKIEKLMKTEIRTVVLPSLTKVLEPVGEHLQQELTQKISSMEGVLKENMSRLVKSKGTMEAVGNSVGAAVQAHMMQAYREAFQSLFVPMFERACQNMFSQLNERFQQGTNDYLLQVETQLKRKSNEVKGITDVTNNQLKDVADNVKILTSSLDNQKQQLEDIHKTVSGQQEQLCNTVISAMRSSTVTPVPHMVQSPLIDRQTRQAEVLQLIKRGNINIAFQQALSASDLQLVIFACQEINPGDLFSQQPCPLDQPVILSLIQQLSTDLSSDTEIKYEYLMEALMNLDTENPVTKEHIPLIVEGLRQKLNSYIQTNPDKTLAKKMKMLLMASKAF